MPQHPSIDRDAHRAAALEVIGPQYFRVPRRSVSPQQSWVEAAPVVCGNFTARRLPRSQGPWPRADVFAALSGQNTTVKNSSMPRINAIAVETVLDITGYRRAAQGSSTGRRLPPPPHTPARMLGHPVPRRRPPFDEPRESGMMGGSADAPQGLLGHGIRAPFACCALPPKFGFCEHGKVCPEEAVEVW